MWWGGGRKNVIGKSKERQEERGIKKPEGKCRRRRRRDGEPEGHKE